MASSASSSMKGYVRLMLKVQELYLENVQVKMHSIKKNTSLTGTLTAVLKRMGRYCSLLYSYLSKYQYYTHVYTCRFLKILYCFSVSISLTSHKHSCVFVVLYPAIPRYSLTCWSCAWHHRVQNNTENIISGTRKDCLVLWILLRRAKSALPFQKLDQQLDWLPSPAFCSLSRVQELARKSV